MFKKATKSQAKLRAALFGPSGAGKTFSALRIASGMGGPIAFIDSERGSASKYADRFEFDVCDLTNKTIAGYVTAINEAAKAGYAVLVIDSLTHAWQELLEEVDQLAKAKYRGNTWSAWSDGTPKQRKLVDAILNYPGHVLATMRSKTEWQTGESKNGKSQPIRVGLAPEQGKGIEYEFDLLLEINPDHQASIIKDRTGKFQDTILDRPGEAFGQELAAWLSDAPPVEKAKIAESSTKIIGRFSECINQYCSKMNAAWADRNDPGDGVIPAWVGELVSTTQLVKHMLDEAGITFPDGGQFSERMKAASELWIADEGAVLARWNAYVKGLAADLKRKHSPPEPEDENQEAALVGAGREPGSDDHLGD